MRRELPVEGNGRIRVNGSPHTLAMLRESRVNWVIMHRISRGDIANMFILNTL